MKQDQDWEKRKIITIWDQGTRSRIQDQGSSKKEPRIRIKPSRLPFARLLPSLRRTSPKSFPDSDSWPLSKLWHLKDRRYVATNTVICLELLPVQHLVHCLSIEVKRADTEVLTKELGGLQLER